MKFLAVIGGIALVGALVIVLSAVRMSGLCAREEEKHGETD